MVDSTSPDAEIRKIAAKVQDDLFWAAIQDGISGKVETWSKIKDRDLAINILVELVAKCLNHCTAPQVEDFHTRLAPKIR